MWKFIYSLWFCTYFKLHNNELKMFKTRQKKEHQILWWICTILNEWECWLKFIKKKNSSWTGKRGKNHHGAITASTFAGRSILESIWVEVKALGTDFLKNAMPMHPWGCICLIWDAQVPFPAGLQCTAYGYYDGHMRTRHLQLSTSSTEAIDRKEKEVRSLFLMDKIWFELYHISHLGNIIWTEWSLWSKTKFRLFLSSLPKLTLMTGKHLNR